jgi:hypothetical protein
MGHLTRAQLNARRQWRLAFLPPLADLVALSALLFFFPAFVAQFERLSGMNALLLSGAYVLFCTAVYAIQKLEPFPQAEPQRPRPLRSRPLRSRLDSWLSPKLLGALGVLFGLAMMFSFTYQMGYLDALWAFNSRSLNSGETAAFLAMAPGAWLGFSLFYMLLLISTFEPAVTWGDGRYRQISMLSLLTINLLLVLMTAQARVIVLALGLDGQWLLLPVAFGLWALLFGPPRLLFLRKLSHPGGTVSAVLLFLVCSWLIVAG